MKFPAAVPLVLRGPRPAGGHASAPMGDWPRSTPEAEGMDRGPLVTIRTAGDCAVFRHGRLVYAYGNPTHFERNWASTTRGVVVFTVWAVALTRGDIPGGLAALEAPIVRFDTPSARLFDPRVTLEHLLRYTGHADPPGSAWVYSGGGDRHGKHWPRQPVLFEELTGQSMPAYFLHHVAPVLGGTWEVIPSDDGTPRFRTSALDAARWAGMMLADGGDLIDASLVRRALTPGPMPVEGFGGLHLVRGGQAWEFDHFDGVPDAFMARSGGSHDIVFGCPSLDLIVAAKSGAHSPETYIPAITRAVIR